MTLAQECMAKLAKGCDLTPKQQMTGAKGQYRPEGQARSPNGSRKDRINNIAYTTEGGYNECTLELPYASGRYSIKENW